MLASSTIRIDVNRPGIVPRLYAMQGEKNVRHVLFDLYEDGVAWEPGENVTAEVHFRRADGTGGSYSEPDEGGPAFSVLASIVGIPINEAVCAKAGPVALSVELSADGAVIATWPVTVMVEANPGCQAPVEDTEQGSGGSGGATPYVIDATSIKVDFGDTAIRLAVLTDIVNVDELLAAHEAGREIRMKTGVKNYDSGEVEVKLDDYYEGADFHEFRGFACLSVLSYSMFFLHIDSDGDVTLQYVANPMGAVVKTVNGVAPDPETGDVTVETAKETPIHTDLSGYYDGTIVLKYADGGSMNVAVTFDANGNPIKFSNGAEEFTITWPAEEATEEVTG